ncbi:hypothetical protein E5082_23105 [Streptomyces griseoluteus]|uniref:Uncharacterized protein n=1 Tax=Streptomyces griseoluteus TaxID=29306 RepID=A0A4Z1DEL0_STRGP|nr:hypothetical protein E5082_23105 [Streptomyces griseoluteus]
MCVPPAPPEQPPTPAITNAVTPATASRLLNIVPPSCTDAQRSRPPSAPSERPSLSAYNQKDRSAVSWASGCLTPLLPRSTTRLKQVSLAAAISVVAGLTTATVGLTGPLARADGANALPLSHYAHMVVDGPDLRGAALLHRSGAERVVAVVDP